MKISLELMSKINVLIEISNSLDQNSASSMSTLGDGLSLNTLDANIEHERYAVRKAYLKSMDSKTAEDIMSIMYIGRDGLQEQTPVEAMKSAKSDLNPSLDIQIDQFNGFQHVGEFLSTAKQEMNLTI